MATTKFSRALAVALLAGLAVGDGPHKCSQAQPVAVYKITDPLNCESFCIPDRLVKTVEQFGDVHNGSCPEHGYGKFNHSLSSPSTGSPPPGAIDTRSIAVSWELRCGSLNCTGLRQQAYWVTIRDRDGRLLVDSGKVQGDQTWHRHLAPALRSARTYTIQVRVWSGRSGPGEASAQFRTALLDEGWKGEWIGGFTQLRGDFSLSQPADAVSSALAHASGVGCFALTVNGKPADAFETNRTYMNPGWSNVPSVRMLYRQFDVTGLLRGDGRSQTLGVRLGQCKFGYQDAFCKGAHGSLATCRAFNLQLTLAFKDGTEQTVITHATAANDTTRWIGTTALNPIRYTHLYHGEIVDGRTGHPDWDMPSYTPPMGPDQWQPAQPYEGASQLARQVSLLRAPPIAATSEIAPVAVTKISEGFVYDFGNNMAGFTRLNASTALPAGTVVTLKYGEVLNKDGTVNMAWGSGSGINQANQTDQYTFRGVPGESFTPSFTYHGFRFVQLEGLPAGVSPGQSFLTALFVRTAMPRSGRVEFGHANLDGSYRYSVLNQIQAAIVQTQASNVHSHPTDCPQREKRGWTGDSQVTSGQCSLNFDAVGMYDQWLQSMADSSLVGCALAPQAPVLPQPQVFECCDPNKTAFGCNYNGLPPGGANGGFSETHGSIADVVPYMHVGGWPGDPSWGVAGATIPWEVMTQTGDLSIAEQYYQLSKGVVDFFSRQGDPKLGGLVTFGYYGDWLSLEPIPKPQTVGWSHMLGMARLANMAERLGKADDAALYRAQLSNLTSAYRAAYLAPDGSFGSSQTANVLALYLNLTQGAAGKAAAVAALVAGLGKHGNRTQSGLVGVSYLFQALMLAGEHQLALSIASATDEPSWGYMVKMGPGTIWETWTDSSNSHNHPMFTASIGKYLYALAGLQPEAWRDPTIPELKPAAGHAATAAAVGSASVSIASRHGAGPIHFSWSFDSLSFRANISVPHGFETARLTMPVRLPTGSSLDTSSFTLVERRSGIRYQIDGGARALSAAGLSYMGVLRMSMLPVGSDEDSKDLAHAELMITPGYFEFELVAFAK